MSSFFVIHAFLSSGTCGSGQYAESMGSSENDTKSDTSTEQAMVSANGLNHWPPTPGMKPIGTNTARIRKGVAPKGGPVWAGPRRDGEPDLVGALARRRVMVFPHLHVAHDVLSHHDRVVDQDADRQRET